MKLGLWIELLHHFNKIFYIVQIGEYYKENKCGKWKIFLKDQIIGGGIYNKQGAKQGKWIELHEKFHEYCWVTLVGEYENGKKIGQWDFIYQKKIIAGGIYLQNGLKNGNWRELSTKFNNFCLLLNEGCYLNGKKFQYWNIISYNSYQILGGGSYNLQGYKNGKWITFNKNYYVGLFSSNCISQVGEYKQGRKHNHWDIINNENEKIGGGEYDHKGMKFGQWTELHQNFWDFCKVTLNGNYYNGHKLGNWEVKYKPSQFEEIQIIGGGMYNENYQKNNKWIELDENFSNQCEVINQGNYQNGFKVGKWTLKDKNNSIAGGFYNYKAIKQGKWIELSKYYRSYFPLLYTGNYLNGQKSNKWEIVYQKRIVQQLILTYIIQVEEEHIKTIVQKVDNGLKSKRVLSINPFKLNKEAITMEKNMGFGIS
ncbi:unnamed protein product [Paramecium sonneborni]|uniref:Uncharacterized protein n=1 Tax=Paramecium sonneborni TaxID=65129 RepID=A0A8S1LZV3_9CILI|nr:unnamed protein product [Paramecium sonneborni]